MTKSIHAFTCPSGLCRGVVVLLALMVFVTGCLFQGEGSSRQQKSGLTGQFVDAHGNALQGAKVSAIPTNQFRLTKTANSTATMQVDSVMTDEKGRYVFEDLPAGEFNLVGEYSGGDLGIFIPDIRYEKSSGLISVGSDTLLITGAIRGKLLRSGVGLEGVVVYLPGTSYLAISDSLGNFIIRGIPKGKYNVNYLVPNFSTKNDTGVFVYSGSTTNLPNKILTHDASLPPPPPLKPQVLLDSVKGIVHVQWNRVDVEDLLGYLIYRDTGMTSIPTLLLPRIITDTTYADVLPDHFWWNRDTVRLKYRIKSVDNDKNQSLSYSSEVSLHAPKKRFAPTGIILEMPGKFQPIQVASGDTAIVNLRFQNPYRGALEIHWKIDKDPSWNQVDTVYEPVGSLSKPIFQPQYGGINLLVIAIDSAKDTIRSQLSFEVVNGKPKVEAGENQTVSLGDSIHLSGIFQSNFATISRSEWVIGSEGRIVETNDGSLHIQAPQKAGKIECIYRAFDHRGRSNEDTAIIEVVNDPPTAKIRAPIEIFAGDTIRIAVDSLGDRFGRVVSMEWSVGESSAFIISTQMETTYVTSATDTLISCKLRVTDDDGQSHIAEALIRVAPKNRWVQTTTDAPFVGFNSIYAWEYDGRLWVSEYNPLQPYTSSWQPLQLWSTSDLLTWRNENQRWRDTIGNPLPPLAIQANGGKIWGIKARPDGGHQPVVSMNGQNWEPIGGPSDFHQIEFSIVKSFHGELVYLGGVSNEHNLRKSNEIWMTQNGSEAIRMPEMAAYGTRHLMRVIEMNDRLWLYGGFQNDRIMNDLWSSGDGKTWVQLTDSALSDPSDIAGMAAYQGEIWILGGADQERNVQEIWRSQNGVNWSLDTRTTPVLLGNPTALYLVPFGERLCFIMIRADRQRIMRGEVWVAP